MLKTKTWIFLLSILLLLSVGLSLFFYAREPKGKEVQILQNGTCIETIDLSAVKEPYTFVVEDPDGGSNTILVEPGRICVLEADCPDQVCVHRGWLSDSVSPIVCLPHRLVIQMTGDGAIDTLNQ